MTREVCWTVPWEIICQLCKGEEEGCRESGFVLLLLICDHQLQQVKYKIFLIHGKHRTVNNMLTNDMNGKRCS